MMTTAESTTPRYNYDNGNRPVTDWLAKMHLLHKKPPKVLTLSLAGSDS